MEVYRSDFYKIIRGYDGFQVWELVSKHGIWLCVDVYDTFSSAMKYIENNSN